MVKKKENIIRDFFGDRFIFLLLTMLFAAVMNYNYEERIVGIVSMFPAGLLLYLAIRIFEEVKK